MATPRSKRAARPAVPVVRREPAERKRLPPELEAFARSEDMRLPRPKRPPAEPKLHDPRAAGLVPGVGNREARAVAEARIVELERLVRARGEAASTDALDRALAEAIALGVWRGRSLTGFDVLAEHVLGLDVAEASAMAERGRLALGWPEGRAGDACVAVWMRVEAALRESGFQGRGTRRVENGRDHVVIDLPLHHAPEGLEAIGRKMGPLVRDKQTR